MGHHFEYLSSNILIPQILVSFCVPSLSSLVLSDHFYLDHPFPSQLILMYCGLESLLTSYENLAKLLNLYVPVSSSICGGNGSILM